MLVHGPREALVLAGQPRVLERRRVERRLQVLERQREVGDRDIALGRRRTRRRWAGGRPPRPRRRRPARRCAGTSAASGAAPPRPSPAARRPCRSPAPRTGRPWACCHEHHDGLDLRGLGRDEPGLLDRAEDLGHRQRRAERLGRRLDRLARRRAGRGPTRRAAPRRRGSPRRAEHRVLVDAVAPGPGRRRRRCPRAPWPSAGTCFHLLRRALEVELRLRDGLGAQHALQRRDVRRLVAGDGPARSSATAPV